MGGPKALVRGSDGRVWVASSTRRLLAAGCTPVRVVLGADASAAAEALAAGVGESVDVVVAADWSDGMAASLRAGLAGLERLAPDAAAVLVHLVDLPDVGADVLGRVLADAGSGRADVLARATYGGLPGHPVLLGRGHWAAVAQSVRGDSGAREYLADRAAALVECGDLATGADVDQARPLGPSVRHFKPDG